jgi:hypothetical protein
MLSLFRLFTPLLFAFATLMVSRRCPAFRYYADFSLPLAAAIAAFGY